jgi:hypothetical protein
MPIFALNSLTRMYEEQREEYEKKGLPKMVGVSATLRRLFGTYLNTAIVEDEQHREALEFLADLYNGYMALGEQNTIPLAVITDKTYAKIGKEVVVPDSLIMLIYDLEATGINFRQANNLDAPLLDKDAGGVATLPPPLPPHNQPLMTGQDKDFIYIKFPKPPKGNVWQFTLNLMGEPSGPPALNLGHADYEGMEHLYYDALHILKEPVVQDAEPPSEARTWGWAVWQMRNGKIVKHADTVSNVKYRMGDGGQVWWDMSSPRSIAKRGGYNWKPAKVEMHDLEATDWLVYIEPVQQEM